MCEWTSGVECSAEPTTLDTTSSRKYAYAHKNIVYHEATEDRGAYWSCDELKVPKDAYAIFVSAKEANESCDDLTDAVLELAEIIGG